MTEVRSTAEALRAISEELRAIERARFRDGEPLPPTFLGSRPWTIAASSFALGFAVTRFVRAAIAKRNERRALPDAYVPPPLEASADDRTFAFANEAFAPSPTPPEAAHASLERQLGSIPEAQLGS